MAKQLNFEDSYEVKGVDKDGNFFDKGACTSPSTPLLTLCSVSD